jgi:hypothetical protein
MREPQVRQHHGKIGIDGGRIAAYLETKAVNGIITLEKGAGHGIETVFERNGRTDAL